MPMGHRERVLAALNHCEPDRVPLDLGSTRNSGIIVEAYEALVKYLGLEGEETRRDDFGQSRVARVAVPSEAVLQRLGIDLRGLYLGKPDRPLERRLPNGDHQDELGVIRSRPPSSLYYDLAASPFDREMTVADLGKWPWPNPADPGYVRGLREQALALRQNTGCAVVLHLQDIIIHPSQFMRGFERWYLDFHLERELLHALLDILLELRTELAVAALRQVGDLVDAVSSSDDIADQSGPIISPEMYREFIKPRHRRYFDALRANTSAKIVYHCCGAITSLVPDFLDLGVDFLNPVQVSATGMDTAMLKKQFGGQIGFWGSIDTMHVLPSGGPDDVRAEVRHRIADLAPGGGFILAAVHNIQPDVPPENIVALFDAARELGTYPIG